MSKRTVLQSATVALCLVALVGCNQKPAGEAKKESKAAGPVLAEVSGATITADYFKKEVDALPPYLKPMAETADGKKELLETMVIRELILQDAQKDGIDKSPAVAEKLE